MFLLTEDFWEIKTTPHKGRGVFAKKDIEAGTIIGDYLGKIVKDSEGDEYEEKYGFYDMYYTDDASVWPDVEKPGIHIINNSCTPNSFMYTFHGHTLYFALRKILAGEEITVSYMMAPLDEDCAPCTDFCKCGSEICSGTMHQSPDKYDKWRAFDDAETAKTPIEPVVFGEYLPKLKTYPANIPDAKVYPLFGAVHEKALILTDEKIPSEKIIRQKIRETGQRLSFEKLGITIEGIYDGVVYSKLAS